MVGAVVERGGGLVFSSAWIPVIARVITVFATVPATGCLAGVTPRPAIEHPTAIDLACLWQEPLDLANRDLFYGPGGPELAPHLSMAFTFIKANRSGYSAGYDVRDESGLEWSVKLGPEAQTEVVVSRILWALGYHQPPTYYLPNWTMTGAQSGSQPEARFRPKLAGRNVVGDWSWYDNDFLTTQPFRGLVVANLMLNNWDWKTSNNKIYEIDGDEGRIRTRVYVVQDLGASLGKTSYPKGLMWLRTRGLGQGSRNDLEGFEAQGFIKRVEGDRVRFYYRGIDQPLVHMVRTGDVVWTSQMMGRLSDAQWHDAFRSAGYADERSRRYIVKLKSKIAEGLKIGADRR